METENNNTLEKRASYKWVRIDKDILNSLLKKQSLISVANLDTQPLETFDFKTASFNQAIGRLHRSIVNSEFNVNEPLTLNDFVCILKKYRQADLHALEADFLFLYQFILKRYAEKPHVDLDSVHASYVEYYIAHLDYFNRHDPKYCIDLAQTIFDQYPSKKTFTTLAHAYYYSDLMLSAYQLIQANAKNFQGPNINAINLKILYHTRGFTAALNYYNQLFSDDKNNNNTKKMLNWRCHKLMLVLFKKEIQRNSNNSLSLLEEAKEYFYNIPAEMKTEPVARVMLNLTLTYESVKAGKEFFSLMKQHKTLSDQSYQEIIKHHFYKYQMNEAKNLLLEAWDTNFLTANQPKIKFKFRKSIIIEQDLHLRTLSSDGVPIYMGLISALQNVVIACLFTFTQQEIEKNSCYEKIFLYIITGQGEGVNPVRERVKNLLRTFGLIDKPIYKNNGMLRYLIDPRIPKNQDIIEKLCIPQPLPKPVQQPKLGSTTSGFFYSIPTNNQTYRTVNCTNTGLKR